MEIDSEVFAPYGTAERKITFQNRLVAFPNGFVVLVAENEIAGFGCSERWLDEREPGLDENPFLSHQPDGRIFCITAMAVKRKFRGRGYSLLVLEKLIETAHLEGCRKVLAETTHDQDVYLKRGFQAIKTSAERDFPGCPVARSEADSDDGVRPTPRKSLRNPSGPYPSRTCPCGSDEGPIR